MLKKATALGFGFVLLAAGLAYAGEPTGRYNGAPGSEPAGAEQVQFDGYANGTDTHYSPADGNAIPMGGVPAAATDKGTTTHYSPADTATIVPTTKPDTAVASHE